MTKLNTLNLHIVEVAAKRAIATIIKMQLYVGYLTSWNDQFCWTVRFFK